MTEIELIYDTDCPNAKAVRTNLLRALHAAKFPPTWKEWIRSDPAAPDYVRAYGSPTILVGGHDVAGASPSDGADCCRLYTDEKGQLRGVPTIETIAAVLSRIGGIRSTSDEESVSGKGWRSIPATLPGIGVVLLPNLTCPACWPAYAGFLSSLGLGFTNYSPYLLPLTTLFMIAAVTSLGYRAKNRRGYKPFVMGVLAAVILIIGRFVLDLEPAMYGGIVLLIGASLWNSWPKKRSHGGSCPACVPAGAPKKAGIADEI